MNVEIGGRTVGEGRPCLVVAEAGSAHGGDLERGFALIDAAAAAGADCVKFQLIIADEIVHPRTGYIDLPAGRVPIYERFRALEREDGFYARLKERAEARGLLFLASVFGPGSARRLRALGAEAVKIASPELNHFPLLREAAGYGLPLILSTGVSTLGDIERALALCPGAAILLHCLTAYPAPEEQYNLRVIPHLAGIFGRPVGLSDHSAHPELVPALAVALGACVVEKHLSLSNRDSGLDDPFALEPKGFAEMVRRIRTVEQEGLGRTLEWAGRRFGRERAERVLGDGSKRLAPAERDNYLTTNRSLHAAGDLPAGRLLRPEDLCVVRSERTLRPGLDPSFLETVLGCRLARPVADGEGITWDDLLDRREAPVPAANPGAGGAAGQGGTREEEPLVLTDGAGEPVGTVSRRYAHGHPEMLHAVVHLHLLDRRGRLYLQRRSAAKDTYPGRWDTSVGGHLAPGESPQQALRREAAEELGIEVSGAVLLGRYQQRDPEEAEHVTAFALVTSQRPRPRPAEIQEGRFFTAAQIDRLLEREPALVTPGFLAGYRRFRDSLRGLAGR